MVTGYSAPLSDIAYLLRPLQLLNLNEPFRVAQLKLPVVAYYSLVYQKVQSSVGSIDIEL